MKAILRILGNVFFYGAKAILVTPTWVILLGISGMIMGMYNGFIELWIKK